MEVFYTIYILFPLLLIVLFRLAGRENESEIVSGLLPCAGRVFIFSVFAPGSRQLPNSAPRKVPKMCYRLSRPGSARGHPFLFAVIRYSADCKNG